MNSRKVDYNSISTEYNKRYSASPLPGVKEKLITLVKSQHPKTILEVGCGTGHWLNVLAPFCSKLFGLDYSKGMLIEACKASNRCTFINADADCLPFREDKFDLIFSVNAIHFFNNKLKFIRNTSKILKRKGTLCIIEFDPHADSTDWYIYKYFSGSYKRDIERYPSFETMKEEMQNIGLQKICLGLIDKINTDKHNCSVLADHFLDQKGSSQMAMLNQKEYESGLNRIKHDLRKAEIEDSDIIFPVRLNFFSLTGIK